MAAAKKKEDPKMLKKHMFVLFASFIVLSFFACDWNAVDPADGASRAALSISITPTAGGIGTVVRIMGGGFTPTNNTIIFAPQNVTGKVYQTVVSATGGLLQFAIPKYLYPPCRYLPSPCAAVVYSVTDGTYLVSVKNANGTSNTCAFRVVGSQVPPPPSPIPGAIPVTEADNGRTIALKTGNVMQLSLKTNPSTGYGWQFTSQPSSAVLTLSNHYLAYENQSQAGMPGAPMIEYWIYQAAGAGSTSIELKYCRSWETVPPLKTFKVNITVSN